MYRKLGFNIPALTLLKRKLDAGVINPEKAKILLKLYEQNPVIQRNEKKIEGDDRRLIKQFLNKYPDYTFFSIDESSKNKNPHSIRLSTISEFVIRQKKCMKMGYNEEKAFEMVEQHLRNKIEKEIKENATILSHAMDNNARTYLSIYEQHAEFEARQKIAQLKKDLPRFIEEKKNWESLQKTKLPQMNFDEFEELNLSQNVKPNINYEDIRYLIRDHTFKTSQITHEGYEKWRDKVINDPKLTYIPMTIYVNDSETDEFKRAEEADTDLNLGTSEKLLKGSLLEDENRKGFTKEELHNLKLSSLYTKENMGPNYPTSSEMPASKSYIKQYVEKSGKDLKEFATDFEYLLKDKKIIDDERDPLTILINEKSEVAEKKRNQEKKVKQTNENLKEDESVDLNIEEIEDPSFYFEDHLRMLTTKGFSSVDDHIDTNYDEKSIFTTFGRKAISAKLALLKYNDELTYLSDSFSKLTDDELLNSLRDSPKKLKQRCKSLFKKIQKFNIKLDENGELDLSKVTTSIARTIILSHEKLLKFILMEKDLEFEYPQKLEKLIKDSSIQNIREAMYENSKAKVLVDSKKFEDSQKPQFQYEDIIGFKYENYTTTASTSLNMSKYEKTLGEKVNDLVFGLPESFEDRYNRIKSLWLKTKEKNRNIDYMEESKKTNNLELVKAGIRELTKASDQRKIELQMKVGRPDIYFEKTHEEFSADAQIDLYSMYELLKYYCFIDSDVKLLKPIWISLSLGFFHHILYREVAITPLDSVFPRFNPWFKYKLEEKINEFIRNSLPKTKEEIEKELNEKGEDIDNVKEEVFEGNNPENDLETEMLSQKYEKKKSKPKHQKEVPTNELIETLKYIDLDKDENFLNQSINKEMYHARKDKRIAAKKNKIGFLKKHK